VRWRVSYSKAGKGLEKSRVNFQGVGIAVTVANAILASD